MSPYVLAVVGAGPSCTYVIERLAAMALSSRIRSHLHIDIFDRSGNFGAGDVHSPTQPTSSILNRITGQISFAADETNEGNNVLLPRGMRPTFYEWCLTTFHKTGQADLDLRPETWPKRYIHGLALSDMFQRYVDLLRNTAGVNVRLHHASVEDIEPLCDGRFNIRVSRHLGTAVIADHVLFVTGHSENDPLKSPNTALFTQFGKNMTGAAYIPYAYPLERRILDEDTGPHTAVALLGMGLTAIDVILYLTEGRGGRFSPDSGSQQLNYIRSGREPKSIVAFGNSGHFTFARPFNEKEKDIELFEHKAVFLTSAAIDRLREFLGVPCTVSPLGHTRQLNFERHVFPLAVLEMAYIYYCTLYGPSFARYARHYCTGAYEEFLMSGGGERDNAIEGLMRPLQYCAQCAESIVIATLVGQSLGNASADLDARNLTFHYVATIFGEAVAESIATPMERMECLTDFLSELPSPWQHFREPQSHRFDWRRLVNPLEMRVFANGSEFAAAAISFMEWDHLQAAQGNVRNPFKAACDGVWRDLRPVIARAIDFGGLEADSHRQFIEIYMRHHNRLANGAGLEPMQKMLALIKSGVVDISIGPRPLVEIDQAKCCFQITGQLTGEMRHATTLIDGRLHAFDPDRDISPLYRNLLARGLIRKWCNPGIGGIAGFEPGGLDLSRDFHPIRADGSVEASLTFLGPPTEGARFFLLGAARPNSNHHVLNDVISWANAFVGTYLDQ